MSRTTSSLPDSIYRYLCSVSLREPEFLAELREVTRTHPRASMQLSPEEGQFIDADKANHWNFYERALKLVRRGGLIGVDNTLWYGKPADPGNHEPDTETIREVNRRLHADARAAISLVPIGDGLTLALKA